MRFFGCAGESGGGITVSRRYDSLGRVIEEKETDGTDTTVNNYSYDVSGNRTEHKLTLSGEVRSWKSYTYDLLGRMKTVGERPILTEKYDYSYKIMIFTMGGMRNMPAIRFRMSAIAANIAANLTRWQPSIGMTMKIPHGMKYRLTPKSPSAEKCIFLHPAKWRGPSVIRTAR